MIKRGVIILFSLLSYSLIIGQKALIQNNTSAPPMVDSNSKLIEFLSAESYNLKKMDSMEYLILVGHVKIRQGTALLYGDSIILNTTKNTLEGFGNIHINDADSVHTYAEYLKYIGNIFVKNEKINTSPT